MLDMYTLYFNQKSLFCPATGSSPLSTPVSSRNSERKCAEKCNK